MTAVEHALDYLSIDPNYSARLGGIRWASSLDSIQFDDDTTFAINPELRLLLEGAAYGKLLPPFSYVLAIYYRMKRVETDRLYRAFQEVKGEAAAIRNAGLLIGELCRGIPGLSTKPSIIELSLLLATDFRNSSRFVSVRAEMPPLSHEEFERQVAVRVERFDHEELVHWLRHGQGRPRNVRRIAEAAELIDQRLRQLLAACRTSERLIGALTISPTMDSALTLPPRKRARESLPRGGYQDVTTRGDPERLLPSQFALDSDEFIRRFAGNELLYFEREVSHASRRPEKILILDQGVRTWGGVRLGLAAGLMTLLKQDPRSFSSIQLSLTSTPESIELLEISTLELTRHLEASDFTPHPGNCVNRVVETIDDPDVPRDLILLTHPRNLREPALLKTLHSLAPLDRFFALSVEETGAAELVEWQHTGFVSLRDFRVDLATAEKAKPEREATLADAPRTNSWSGWIEPIPFPFGVGLIDEIHLVQFDGPSHSLILVSRHGIPHCLDLASGQIEVMPRALYRGVVLSRVHAILPTNDGIVLVGSARVRAVESEAGGTILSTDPILSHGTSKRIEGRKESDRYLAAHYDFPNRTVKVHDLGAVTPSVGWYSYPDLHCIALHTFNSEHKYAGIALDLMTGEWFMGGVTRDIVNVRLFHAWNRQGEGQVAYLLPVVPHAAQSALAGKGPYLQQQEHRIQVHRWEGGPVEFEPILDGKPLLEGATIWQAHLCDTTLALHIFKQQTTFLYLFHLPTGRLIREIPWTMKAGTFALSPSRNYLGMYIGRWEARVLNLANDADAPIQVSRGKLHNNFELLLLTNPFQFIIKVGRIWHKFTCQDGTLRHSAEKGSLEFRERVTPISSIAVLAHDPSRYLLSKGVVWGGLQAVIDRFGQVLLLRSTGELVALFLVRGSLAAVWIPTGIFWGDPLLIGAAPHPHAAKRVGEAIQNALDAARIGASSSLADKSAMGDPEAEDILNRLTD